MKQSIYITTIARKDDKEYLLAFVLEPDVLEKINDDILEIYKGSIKYFFKDYFGKDFNEDHITVFFTKDEPEIYDINFKLKDIKNFLKNDE